MLNNKYINKKFSTLLVLKDCFRKSSKLVIDSKFNSYFYLIKRYLRLRKFLYHFIEKFTLKINISHNNRKYLSSNRARFAGRLPTFTHCERRSQTFA